MNKFEYDVYYRWDGPSHSDPYVTEKTQHEIEAALRSFHGELEQKLDDPDATAFTSPVVSGCRQVRLAVATNLSRAAVDAALVSTLQDWRLYATRIG